MLQTSPDELKCPRCGLVDGVRKVSSVHSEGVSTSVSYVTGGGVGVTAGGRIGVVVGGGSAVGTQQSLLSRRLVPPAKWEPSYSHFYLFAPIILLLIVAGVALFMAGGTTKLAVVGTCLAGAGAAVGLFVVRERQATRQAAAAQATFCAQMSVWNRLYYCTRDDGVFDPAHGKFIPIDDMRKYIEERARL